MSMILGGLEGMTLGAMAGGIGAIPGTAIGITAGYASAVATDKIIDTNAPHIHSKLSEFADYAQSIGRDELESSRNRYVAEAMGQGALTGLAVVGMTRGKPASKNLLSGLDLATSTAKRSFIAKPHVRSSANRISAEKWLNQNASPSLPIAVPGRVQSRINIISGKSKIDISHPGSKKPGIDSIWKKHMNSNRMGKSQFTISKDEVISIVKDKNTVKAPITRIIESGNYVREVNVGHIVGHLPAKKGSKPTTTVTILSDKEGNLVNIYPGPFEY